MNAPSRQRSLTSDYAYALVARAASVVSSAALTVLTARWLGVADRGVYVLLSTLVTVLWTAGNLGIGLGTTYHAGRGGHSLHVLRENALVSAALLGVPLAVLGYFVATSGLTTFAGIGSRLIAIAVLGVPAIMAAQFLGSLLLGAQLIREYNVLLIIYSLIQLVAIGGVLLAGGSVAGALVAALVSHWAWLLVSLRASARLGARVDTSHTNWGTWKAVFAYGLRGQLGNIVQLLNYRLDFFLVSSFLGPAALAVYSVAVMVGESLWQLSNSMAVVLFPRVAALAGNEDERRRILGTASRVALGMTLSVALVVGLTAHLWVPRFFGVAYTEAASVIRLLLPGVVLFTVQVVLSSGIAGAGFPEWNSYVAAVSLVLSVALDVWMIPRYGIPGAAIASSLTYGTSTLLTIWNYRRLSHISLRELLVPTPADVRMLLGSLQSLANKRSAGAA